MAEDAIGFLRRPCQHGFADPATEVALVHGGEYLFEVINFTFCGGHNLAATRPFVHCGPLANVVRFNKGVIDVVRFTGNLSAEQFPDEYERQPALSIERHVAANLANSYKTRGTAYADRMIYANIRVKYYVQRRHRACRVIMTKRFLVN